MAVVMFCRALCIAAFGALLGACVPMPAAGDPYGGTYGGGYSGGGYGSPQPVPVVVSPRPESGGAVRCESQDGRTRECATGFRARAQLVENLSDTRCVEGRNWGDTGRGSVWVQGGCRGVFAEAGGYGYGQPSQGGWVGDGRGAMRCESEDGRLRECAVPVRGRVELVRQLSDTRCVEGRNWGQQNGRIWVSQGCRGEFAVAGAAAAGTYGNGRDITCASESGRTTTCRWDARLGRPRLLEQLSDSACQEGLSWGVAQGGDVWVSRGCRGRFGVR